MFYIWQQNNLILKVYVQTKASKDELVGEYADSLKIKIIAPPLEGKANQYLQKFLAKQFAVPLQNVELIKGEKAKKKTFLIKSPQQLIAGIKNSLFKVIR
ncbi:MAG: YggU family protein [Gammaproteobacteria bacterium RIFCSPHIGHO2_12_FULL_35_23]|nr:MAG: YggU family protein [Gammaproteobacteria bacterium RIFCSPHIGHO2_12_FULL_35_23]